MTNKEAIKMIKAELECRNRQASGTDRDCIHNNCEECHLLYEQGAEGEQKEALDMAIKALEQEPCEDCISRQAVQDLINTWLTDYLTEETREALEVINGKVGDMPSVQPTRPKGKWIPYYDRWGDVITIVSHFKCSVCGEYDYDKDKFCPNCGADMRGEAE
jgi:hypothetical protein